MDIKTRLARLEKLRRPTKLVTYGLIQQPDGAVYITRDGRAMQYPVALLQMSIDEL